MSVCLNPTLQRTVTLEKRLVVGDVNRANNCVVKASGKGINVTRVLTQLHVNALHLCQAHIGSSNANTFLSLAEKDGVKVRTVDCGENTDVRCCTTIIDASTSPHTMTEIVEPGARVESSTEDGVLHTFKTIISEFADSLRVVVISGSKAPGFSSTLFGEMTRFAKEQGLFVLLDIRGNDLVNCLPFHPDVVKPNVSELVETLFPESNAETITDEDLRKCLLDIWKKHGVRSVITRGAKPTVFVDANGMVSQENVESLNVSDIVNTIGCGDSFAAGFAASVVSHQEKGDKDWIREAVKSGHHAAALNAKTLCPGSIEP